MADSTLDSELFYLNTGMWGAPNPKYGTPDDGFTGSDHHNVATEVYPLGTVIAYYNDGTAGVAGWSEFVYCQMEGTSAPTCAVKQICVQDAAGAPFVVTNDPDSALVTTALLGQLAACVALSAMTDAYYGWFYCGGVVPEGAVSGLGGNFATVNNVAAGYPIMVSDLTADAIGIGLFLPASATANTGTHNSNVPIGLADTADA